MTAINNLDNQIYNLLRSIENANITCIMIFISYMGSAIALVVLSIGLYILIKNKKNSKFIVLNLILSYFLNETLKLIIRRQRPPRLQIIAENGYSFPSGHSMISFAYYGFLIYLVNKNIKNKKIKTPLIVFLSLLILVIGISRIYLGVHYVTDVIGGFVFGFIYLFLLIKYVYNYKKVKQK